MLHDLFSAKNPSVVRDGDGDYAGQSLTKGCNYMIFSLAFAFISFIVLIQKIILLHFPLILKLFMFSFVPTEITRAKPV